MQVTDKRIHQVKIELSLQECTSLRRAIDHYLTLYSQLDNEEKLQIKREIDVDTLRAMASHLSLVETSDIVEHIRTGT
jgi:ribosomal protein S13